jgi:hypothetical protein
LARLLETGAALAAGKMIYLVSPHPWQFLRNHPRVKSFRRLEDAVAEIRGTTTTKPRHAKPERE